MTSVKFVVKYCTKKGSVRNNAKKNEIREAEYRKEEQYRNARENK